MCMEMYSECLMTYVLVIGIILACVKVITFQFSFPQNNGLILGDGKLNEIRILNNQRQLWIAGVKSPVKVVWTAELM